MRERMLNRIELPPSPWQRERWITQASLVGACLSSSCGGVVYAFSLYGPQLAAKLNLNSTQLNTIAMSGNMGVLVSGPLFGYLADTRQPSQTVKISSLLFLLGFLGMALTYEGVLPYKHFLILAGYYFMVGIAGGCSYISSTSTTGHNFKNYRGFGIGLPVTFFGLSAFLFSILNQLFFVEEEVQDTVGFLKFLGLVTSLVTFFSSFLLRKFNYARLLEESRSLRGPLSSGYRAIEPEFSVTSPTLTSTSPPTCLSLENNIGGWELLFNTDAQLLSLCVMLIGGTGLVYINNLGTVLHTLDFLDPVPDLPWLQSLSVSALSLANCGGRLLFTALSDYLANSQVPFRRVSWLMVSALLVGTIHFVTAYAPSHYIPACATLLGLGYGICFAVGPTVTSYWFGTAQYGANWGWINTSPALGGQLFGLIFGLIYDHNSSSPLINNNHLCPYGSACYRSTFLLMGGVCLIAFALAFLLQRRRARY